MISRAAFALLLASQGCSFGTAAIQGKAHVRAAHSYIDVALFTAAGLGCTLAAVAWVSPDSYAPVSEDSTSWATPQDRVDTIESGKKWTPWACATTAVFLVSSLYGNSVKSPDESSSGSDRATPYYTAPSTPPVYAPPSTSTYGEYSGGYSNAPEANDDSSDSEVTLCDNGNAFACKDLGDAYSTGRSMASIERHRIDWRRAVDFYSRACEHGNEDSCLVAARAYRDGDHVAADEKRAFELFKRACGGFADKGCADMRALSGTVGRLKYTGGEPDLAWHCGDTWCFSDPLRCDSASDGSCHEARTAVCSAVKSGDSVYQTCAAEQSTCEAALKAEVSNGKTKVSECTERLPTVPGEFAGDGWYCSEGLATSCKRLIGFCRPSYGGQCNLQQTAACVVAFDLLNSRYVSKCFPSLQACKYDYSMKSKEDYSERSGCFTAK